MLYWSLYTWLGFNNQQCCEYKNSKTNCSTLHFTNIQYKVFMKWMSQWQTYFCAKFTSVCLWCFIPSVLLSTRCTMAWSSGAWSCMSRSWFPEAGAGSGTWSLTSLSSPWCLVPLTSRWCRLQEIHTHTGMAHHNVCNRLTIHKVIRISSYIQSLLCKRYIIL